MKLILLQLIIAQSRVEDIPRDHKFGKVVST